MNRRVKKTPIRTSGGRSVKTVLSMLLTVVITMTMIPTAFLSALEPDDGVVAGETTPAASDSASSQDVDFGSKGVGQQTVALPSLDQIQCASYFCYDRTTGRVLLSKNEDTRIYPASMTKIMTLALAMEYLDPFEKITVSKSAMDATTPNSTMMGLVVGEELEANEIYYGLMLPSGNDAANVLAEEIAKHYKAQKGALPTTTPVPNPPDGVSSTEDPNTFSLIGQFAYIANMKIRSLGLTNSHFLNPNGLQNDNHYTTAHDLAMMFDYALNFEDFCTVIHAPTHFFKADNKHDFDGWKVVKNTNNLLTDPWMIGLDAHCAEVYGGKTGTTKTAGTGMTVLTINENGHEIITCVCGIPYDLADRQSVYVASVVREANLKCWESDPVTKVEGNLLDNRAYNSPNGEDPTGNRSDVTVSRPEDPEDTSAEAPATTSEPIVETVYVTPVPEEKGSLLEEHPLLMIVLIVLLVVVSAIVIVLFVSIAKAKRRRKKAGIRRVL